ncbi:MAG: hypothetical protein HZB39_06070, partial [Planctomycetes bacterium]|nr:hypothetical protein [Planctomycetota bacterium]
MSAEGAAQAIGVQSHGAPVNQSAPPGYNQPASTPQLNVPDGIWNNGEGFRTNSTADADYGGHHGSAEPGVDLGDIFGVEQTIGGTPGWKQVQFSDPYTDQVINLWRFVGYLRPGQLGAYPAPVAGQPGTIQDAAFELFLPDPVPSTTQVMLVLNSWATTGWPAIRDGGRHAYPGKARHDGLAGTPAGILRQSDPTFA